MWILRLRIGIDFPEILEENYCWDWGPIYTPAPIFSQLLNNIVSAYLILHHSDHGKKPRTGGQQSSQTEICCMLMLFYQHHLSSLRTLSSSIGVSVCACLSTTHVSYFQVVSIYL